MRTFIAIDISPNQNIQDFLINLSQNLQGLDIKYTELNNLHITLAFLGESTENQIKNLCNDLNSINQVYIELELQGFGLFKNNHNPQVIWIGIKPNEALKELWRQVNQSV